MTRRGFLRNLGVLAGVLSVGLTVTMPQQKRKILLLYDHRTTSQIATLVGYKGSQFLETGAVYAPYIPLYKTPDIVPYIPPKFIYKYARLTSGKNLLQLD